MNSDLFFSKLRAGVRGVIFFAARHNKIKGRPKKIVYITESADWAVRRVGYYVAKGVAARGLKCEMDVFPHFHRDALLHIGSLSCFKTTHVKWYADQRKRIITVFHGDYGINKNMDGAINALLEHKDIFDRFVVSNSIMKHRMSLWGVDTKKITTIPIGVDLTYFEPLSGHSRARLRKDLGIPDGCICIGSFQKDGIGWGDGVEPKRIKGPDVFVEAVERIARKHRVHCLLTGPARGYVKQELEKRGIPYTHRFIRHYYDLSKYYNCLDLYLVTSREEGGPKAILEAMASGIPVVSTPVGMAVDVLHDKVNGLIAEGNDAACVADKVLYTINSSGDRNQIVNNGLKTVKKYEWDIISDQYYALYTELLNEC